MVKRIQSWWAQPDHFAWFGSYLQLRGMTGMTRVVLATMTGSSALLPLGLLLSDEHSGGLVRVALAVLSIAGGATCSLMWILRWPTKSESVAFAVLASTSIAAAALAQGDPMIALLICTAFVMVSAYVAIFHTAAMMVAHTVVVVLVSAIPAAALAANDGWVRAVSLYGLVVVVNVAVPFGIQILTHALGVDLVEADRDPLTGLLNRRAFYERTCQLVATYGGTDSHVVVAMVDLDRFKLLNDTQGHAAGDRALIAVAQALRERTHPDAVVGRAGGEEFLIADVFVDPRSVLLGARLCDGVAELPYAITASVGTASARCDQVLDGDDPNQVLAELVAAADAAMYDAKRNGGNQSRQRLAPLGEFSR